MDLLLQLKAVAQTIAFLGEKHHPTRGKQLLEGPASSEPSAIDKGCLLHHRYIRQIDIALSCVSILAIHRIDRVLNLDWIGLVDAISVHPEVTQAITSSLSCAEADFVVARLAASGIICQVVKGHLLAQVCDSIAYAGTSSSPMKSFVKLNVWSLTVSKSRIAYPILGRIRLKDMKARSGQYIC